MDATYEASLTPLRRRYRDRTAVDGDMRPAERARRRPKARASGQGGCNFGAPYILSPAFLDEVLRIEGKTLHLRPASLQWALYGVLALLGWRLRMAKRDHPPVQAGRKNPAPLANWAQLFQHAYDEFFLSYF
jgi:hypothetical protein